MTTRSRFIPTFPVGQIKGADYSYNPGCGGLGGGSCILPADYDYIYWPVKVSPFSVFNRQFILRDTTFLPYTNAGSNVTCPDSNGVQQAFDVYLLYKAPVASLDVSAAVSHVSVPNNVTLPFDMTFEGSLTDLSKNQIPQPTNPLYERRIWVAIKLPSTGLMTGGIIQTHEAMKTINLDWEGRP